MAGKTKPGIPVKGINIKLKMINDLMDVTGSAKDSWNPAEISDDMKAIACIHDLADTWNPAQLNEALKYLGFATIDSWNPAIIEETKNKLVKYFLPTDASGNPIELDLKGSLPYEVTALTIDLLPIQDLHGYDSPWAGGAGKNKLPVTMASSTSQGITATVYDDGTVLLNGKSTGLLILTLNNTLTLNGNYILSGCPSGGSAGTFRMDCYWTGQGALIDDGNGVAISPNGNVLTIRIVVMEGVTLNNQLFKPMIRLATVTDTTFAPYSNICPISGRNSVTLTVNEEDTEITLPQTVYGATLDVTNGKLTIDTKYSLFDGTESGWTTRTGGAGQLFEKTLAESVTQSDTQIGKCNELNWNNYLTTEYSYRIRNTTLAVCLPSSYSTVDSFETWLASNNLQITYPLNTPIEITLTAEQISLLKGNNVLSTDGDNINITYKAILNS